MSMQVAPNRYLAKPIEGAGIDSPDKRPGVPMENDPPQKAGNAHWSQPDRQSDPGTILKRKGLEQLTPVFGTAVPPRGLSGIMRRYAYSIAEHETSHWGILLLADRVDALEGRVRKALPYAVPLAIFGVAVLAVRGLTRKA